MNAVLEIDSLAVHYGRARAVGDLSMQVGQSEIVCLLGANGAGKTSTLKAVCGLLRCSAGSVRLLGHDVTNHRPWQIAELGVSYVPQGRRCFRGLTVEENLLMGAIHLTKATVAERVEEAFSTFPALRDKRSQEATQLSGGQQQMVAVARGLFRHPELLLLDEPSLGLSPRLVDELAQTIVQLPVAFRTSIVVVEQNFELARAVASRGYLLSSGSVASQGPMAELAADVRRVYLGE